LEADVEVLREMVRLLEEGRRVALCTIVEKRGSGPRDVGAKMVVCEDGRTFGTIGGGNLERALVDESLKALGEGRSRRAVFSLGGGRKDAIDTGLICGGELTIFIDVVEPKRRLILVGAGHIALPLARLADVVGFKVVVVDDNVELATRERFPMAEEIIVGEFSQVLDRVDVGSRDFVVITHGEPEHDYLALEKIIRRRPAYLGLLGSRTKVATFVKRLKDAGVGEEDLRILHAPVGLEIGAQTPGEIGVSILAEIISGIRKASSGG